MQELIKTELKLCPIPIEQCAVVHILYNSALNDTYLTTYVKAEQRLSNKVKNYFVI